MNISQFLKVNTGAILWVGLRYILPYALIQALYAKNMTVDGPIDLKLHTQLREAMSEWSKTLPRWAETTIIYPPLSRRQRLEILERDKYICRYCSRLANSV